MQTDAETDTVQVDEDLGGASEPHEGLRLRGKQPHRPGHPHWLRCGCRSGPMRATLWHPLTPAEERPVVMGPLVCRLCETDFGTEEAFAQHKQQEHAGEKEYRKRVLFLMAEAGCLPITAQPKSGRRHFTKWLSPATPRRHPPYSQGRRSPRRRGAESTKTCSCWRAASGPGRSCGAWPLTRSSSRSTRRST